MSQPDKTGKIISKNDTLDPTKNIYKVSKEETLLKILDQSKKMPLIIMISSRECKHCKKIKPLYKDLANNNKNVMFIVITAEDYIEGKTKILSEIAGYPTFMFYYRKRLLDTIYGSYEDRLTFAVKFLDTLQERVNIIDEFYDKQYKEILVKAYTDEVLRLRQQEIIRQRFIRQLEMQKAFIASKQGVPMLLPPKQLPEKIIQHEDDKSESDDSGHDIPESDTDEEVKKYVSPNKTTKTIKIDKKT